MNVRLCDMLFKSLMLTMSNIQVFGKSLISSRIVMAQLFLLPLLLLFSSDVFALYPRAYIPAPAGTFLLVAYDQHGDSDGRYANGDKLNIDMDVDAHIGILRPVYYFKWLDRVAVINASFLFGEASLKGSSVVGDKQVSRGIGDPIVHAGVFLINKPRDRFWLGVSEYITLPLGEYDNTSAINLGENRLTGKTELGLAKGLGKYHLDVTLNVTIYGSNTNFSVNSGKLERDELWGFETHLSRNITNSSYLGLGAKWEFGGESQLNDVKRNDEPDTRSVQISYSNRIAPKHALAMYYKKDLEVENGFKANTFFLRYNYVF